ncbi:hypothetical protein BJV82DRAFT_673251 [Fennellomyces sp. T-0311]|nr:hypothetical protein BJV82DRAFT_673251 [Fennellomyces sp. T-0311]
MVQTLDLSVLSLAVPTQLKDMTTDNISAMWNVFSKCKDNLENGRRLENLSWRLWYRESTVHQKIAPIPIGQKVKEEYCEAPSAGSSMNDSAVSGCGRSAKVYSPVEETNRRASSARKPTTETTRLSSHDSSTQTRFYMKEKTIHDDDTCSEWSAQDDETVFAQDEDEDDDWHFRKQMPKKGDDLPKRSLLSIMLQKEQRHMRRPWQQKKPRMYHRHGDLSESLQFCVEWERRQNVSRPVALLHPRRAPACVATSRATATCTTSSWFEPFRGW